LCFSGNERELNVGVQQQLQELKLQKDFVFVLGAYSEDRKVEMDDAKQMLG
jgi:hypothetical protein